MRAVLLLTFAVLFLAACGGDQASNDPSPSAPALSPAPAPEASAQATDVGGEAAGPATEVVITPVGNEMRYEQTEFTVAPGQRVRLVMQNTATSPAMSHNIVVVRDEAAINPVGQAAMSAAATDYVPARERARIIAYTPMAAPGQTTEVVFTAPSEPGAYPFICTYPGHYLMMQGTMRVEA